jgi:hypothetical protein
VHPCSRHDLLVVLHVIKRYFSCSYTTIFILWPASWSSGQNFWLLIMRSWFRFPALPWEFFLEEEDSHGDHGLGSLVEFRLRPLLLLHIHVSPSNSSGQRNCASWASQPQKSITLRPQPGGETTKFIRDMWWHWKKNIYTVTMSPLHTSLGRKFEAWNKLRIMHAVCRFFS